ncbi:hypothetical protein DXG01_016433, partial [Tephrocybe rancida]
MGHLYFTPRRALRAQLAGFRDIWKQSDVPHEAESVVPKDPRALSSMFLLDDVTYEFITCPKCYALYPFTPMDNSDNATPARCTHKVTPTSTPCDVLLWKECDLGGGRTKSVPRLCHLHHDLKSWLGRLLSRPGMEDEINSYRYTPPTEP